ncbi:AMP-binding protein [Streptomyces sp. NPDC050161]|uniref:fatty acyl-AMP ligase n=1 Tax=Streptomyces sp. NPDC050161 TaxID=3365604 RepID=UPI0037879E20
MSEQPNTAFPSLPAALSHWAAQRPDDVAYVFASQDGEHRVSYRELEQSALGVAAFLQSTAQRGDRVLLLLPPGLDYLTAFLGCLYAGVAAVPLYPPRPGAKLDRIEAVVRDCRPSHALTSAGLLEHLQDIPRFAGTHQLELHSVESVREAGPGPYRPVALDGGELAFLQYTSGSTGQPKGVMVGHGNLVENERAIAEGFGIRPDDVILSWLPLYHDMGLIGAALLPLYFGIKAVLLDTFAFIHDPLIWPEAISRYGATCSGGPNFAYQLLADRYDADRLAGVDLASWRIAFNGAEPIIPATLESFAALYGRHGFDERAVYPCYGLAEATLFVSGAEPMTGYRSLQVSRRTVERGRLDHAVAGRDEDVVTVVSCGKAAARTGIVIRSDDGRALADGEVGEICVRAASVAGGYWGRPEVSEDTFRARVAGQDGTFLRTGDLGALREGQLYPVGRRKDLIIVAGRNFYPHDIENVATAVSGDLRRGCAAAFQPDLAEPRVVLVLEAARAALSRLRADAGAVRELAAAVRRRVGTECGLDLAEVVFVFPGSVPKTSSGKIRRSETRQRFIEGRLRRVGEAAAEQPGPEAGAVDVRALAASDPQVVRAALAQLVAPHVGAAPTPDDFAQPLAALGLDSLKLVALRTGIERHAGRRVGAELFFGDRSLDDVAQALATGAPAGPGAADGEGEVPPADPDRPYPATEGQVQFQFRHELLPDDTAQNLPVALHVGRRLDPERIRAAVGAVMARHPALRTTLGEPGTGTQVLHEPGALRLDFSHWETGADDDGEARRLLADVAHRRFDLTGGPLVRAAAVCAPGSTVLLLTAHHAVVDYWSLRIVLAELLSSLLDTPLPGPGQDAAGAALGAVDWARHQARALDTPDAKGRVAEAAEKWRPFRGHLLFPSDRPAPRRRTPAGVVDFAADAGLTRRVYEDARAQGQTPFAVLAAAYLRALHRVTGQERIVIATPYHNRSDWRFSGTVGYLVNMVPLLGDFRSGDAAGELRARTWQELRRSMELADVPFSRLVKALEPPRHGQNPLFQATLTFQQSADGLLDDGFAIPWSGCRQTLGDVQVGAVDIPPRDTAFAVSLYGTRDGDRLVFRLEHQEHLVPAETAHRVRDAFQAALAEFTGPADPPRGTKIAGG